MAGASSVSDVSNVITSTDLACVSAYGEEILRVERIALHTQDLARVTLTIIKKYQDRLRAGPLLGLDPGGHHPTLVRPH